MNDYLNDLPQLDAELFRVPDGARLRPAVLSTHAPRFLLLYGSLRERSFSRLLVEEAARLLAAMGAEVRVFNPSGLPLPDDAPDSHPKVVELRELVMWSEGMVWWPTTPSTGWRPISTHATTAASGGWARRSSTEWSA
ncbi:UNVERIFIED_ORG: hypothetical protein J2811_003107 [Burkholderia cepacia]|nr:hypothetical protein [Burkholderia cepacia]MDP9595993.1 hypothetical protein [Burkholderia cepacia]MDP9623660.1 hypothetical protein [Burkholderia cepacia]MDP9669815.1 hypothetical protein [Burkholderia cepacia]MDP9716747.1 hypothetical protein [Burkholderia cepacia]